MSAAASSIPEPVGGLRFSVSIDDAVIGWFSECRGLAAEWDVLEYQEGGQNGFTHKLRSRVTYPNLVLTRGVTTEDAFLSWLMDTSRDWSQRGNVTVTLHGPDGRAVRTWAFLNAFPVKWQGPTLNAGSSDAATETLEIAHQGLSPER